MATADDLKWALAEFKPGHPRISGYRKYQRYYDGNQPLAFATEKYRTQFWLLFRGFSDNMCQSVVDVQAERLEVIGFNSSAAEVREETYDADGNKVSPDTQATEPNPVDPAGAQIPKKTVTVSVVDDPQGEAAWGEWEDETMDLIADEVHADVFKFGDAFVMVDENGVWRQDPTEIAVRYSREYPGVITTAAKCWKRDDGYVQLNIYSQEPIGEGQARNATITKFVSKTRPQDRELLPRDFAEQESGDLPNGIPVIHFANKAYGRYGISELKSVIPLQDALNKAEMDLILSMEYQAFRQRWVTGVDVEIDPDTGLPKNFPGRHGPGNFLALPDPEAKVGEFAAGDLKPYVDVIENIRGQIARVSGIPLYYFYVGQGAGATQSGESLKVGEMRFTRKGKRQQRCLGKSWEITMDLVLEVTSGQDDELQYDPSVDLNVVWDEVSPRSESEELDVLVKKSTIGVPNSQLQKEAGYDPEEIQQFAIEYAQNVKLGLQAMPSFGQDRKQKVPGGAGATPGSATSQANGAQATAPVQD